jgi:hypothetical protein
MLAFHSHCQLGNQMFIYACAHSLAKEQKQSYCLSDLRDLTYFVLSKEDYRWNSFKWLIFRFKNVLKKFDFQHLQDNWEDYLLLLKENKGKNIWYYGYFQGEKYFFDNEQNIKSRFEIKQKYRDEFDLVRNKKCGDKQITVIHIRLKDYKTFGPDYLDGPDLTLPFSYYHDLIKSKIPEDNMIVFLSDEIEIVKDEFSYVKKAYFSENSSIVDLQFIINASTCILSCSTFSWWGAWLNKNDDKTIYVPNYFLGFKVKKEYPVNIIPENWTKIEIYE